MARNVNGSIYFGIGLDNEALRRDAIQSQKILQGIGNTAVSEGARIDTTFRNIAKSVGLVFGAQQAVQFAQSIVQVRGEFQKLETAFGVLLGSKERADKLMQQAIDLAATTPFSLQDVASGSRQLLAYGFAAEDVIGDLRRLGDVAAALGLPLERLTYLYGTTMTQGQLYSRDLLQFTTSGIPMLQALSDQFGVTNQEMRAMIEQGKIGFPEVQKAIYAMTGEGGRFNNMMGEMAKTIPGQIEKLKDAIDIMFNEIGKSSEGAIYSAISGAASLVENYEKVGKILLEIAATYGTYRAALIAMNFVQAQHVVFQKLVAEQMVIERALRKGATADMIREAATTKALAIAKQGLANNIKTLAKSLVPKPYVLAAAAVAGLAFGIYKLITYQTDAEKAQSRLNDALKESEKASLSETRELARLKGELSAATKGTDEYNKIKEKIVSGYGKYYDGLAEEIEKVGLLGSTYESLTKSIMASFGARQYEKFAQGERDNLDEVMSKNLGKIQERLIDKLGDEAGSAYYAKIRDAILTGTADAKLLYGDGIKNIFSINGLDNETSAIVSQNKAVEKWIYNITNAQKLSKKIDDEAKVKFGIGDVSTPDGTDGKEDTIPAPTYKEVLDKAKKEWDEAKKALSEIEHDKDRFTQKQYEDAKAREDTAKKAYAELGGSTSSKASSDAEKAAADRADLQRKLEDEVAQAEIEAMSDGYLKKRAQAELDFEREKADIVRRQEELRALQNGLLTDGQTAQFASLTRAASARYNSTINAINQEDLDVWKAEEIAFGEYLIEYGDFQEKRLAITEKYNKLIAEAGTLGEAMSLEKERDKALSDLDISLAEQSDLWSRLFGDVRDMSSKTLKKVIADTKKLLAYLKTPKEQRIGMEKPIGFTDEQLDALSGDTEKIKAVYDELIEKQDAFEDRTNYPFSNIIKGFGNLKKAMQGVDEEGDKLTDAQTEAAKSKGLGQLSAGAVELTGFLSGAIEKMKELAELTGDERLGDFAEKSGAFFQNIGAAAKGAQSGGWIGAIIGGVTDLISQATEGAAAVKAYVAQVKQSMMEFRNEMQMLELDRLVGDNENIFGQNILGDIEGQGKKALEAIRLYNKAINKELGEFAGKKSADVNTGLAVLGLGFGWLENENTKKYETYLDAVKKGYNELEGLLVRTKNYNGFQEFFGKKDEYMSLKDFAPELWKDGVFDVEAAERFLAAVDDKQITQAQREQIENVIELKEAYDEAMKTVEDHVNSIIGNLSNNIADNMVNAFLEAGDAAANLDDIINDMSKNMAKSLVQTLLFEKVFTNDFEKDILDKFISGDTEAANEALKGAVAEAGALAPIIEQIIASLGLASDTADKIERTSASQGFAQASQDSIDKIDGILTNIQNHTYGIFELMKSSVPGSDNSSGYFANIEAPVISIAEMMRTNRQIQQANTDAMLGHLSAIHTNTNRLEAVENHLAGVNRRLDDVVDGVNSFVRG